jgi:hypothetical protein
MARNRTTPTGSLLQQPPPSFSQDVVGDSEGDTSSSTAGGASSNMDARAHADRPVTGGGTANDGEGVVSGEKKHGKDL